MLVDTGAIRNYFAKLGFESEIADIYLALHADGPQTISGLARSSHVERTRIYRLIDKLMESNLIEVETRHKRGMIKAAPITNLHILIKQKEHELRTLHDELGLIEQVLARNSLSSPACRVQFYQGPEGIRHMVWNQLNAKSELCGYSYHAFDDYLGKQFMERWSEESKKRAIHRRLLTYHDTVKSHYDKNTAYRHVSPSDFKITFSSNIYDDVVAQFIWEGPDIYGMETYSPEMASSQQQLFEILWQRSKSTP